MSELMLVRRVPATRDAVTRRALAGWPRPLADPTGFADDGVDWWELVDPACDDEHPPAALAAVHPGEMSVRLVGLATPPGRHDRAVQVLIALVDALRATSARTLVARPAHGREILHDAGFRPLPDGQEAVDL